MIPVLSKLLLKRLPRDDIDALRGVRGVCEPSPRITRFCSIFGVSRGASGRNASLIYSGSCEWLAARRSSSVSISMRRTSSSTTPSSSGDLCLFLLLGALLGAARSFLLGGCDGPAIALVVSRDGWEGSCWGFEPRIITRPPRCSSPLMTVQDRRAYQYDEIKSEYMGKRVRFRLLDAEFYSVHSAKAKQTKSEHSRLCACVSPSVRRWSSVSYRPRPCAY